MTTYVRYWSMSPEEKFTRTIRDHRHLICNRVKNLYTDSVSEPNINCGWYLNLNFNLHSHNNLSRILGQKTSKNNCRTCMYLRHNFFAEKCLKQVCDLENCADRAAPPPIFWTGGTQPPTKIDRRADDTIKSSQGSKHQH